MHEYNVLTFLALTGAQGVTISVPLSIHSFISLSKALNPTLYLDSPSESINIYIRVRQSEPKIFCPVGEVPHPAKM